MTPRPTMPSLTEELYERMAPLVGDDEAHDWAALHYIDAFIGMSQSIADIVRDDDQGRPGWSAILDVDRVPMEALGWLGQFVGVTIPRKPDVIPLPLSPLTDDFNRANGPAAHGWLDFAVGMGGPLAITGNRAGHATDWVGGYRPEVLNGDAEVRTLVPPSGEAFDNVFIYMHTSHEIDSIGASIGEPVGYALTMYDPGSEGGVDAGAEVYRVDADGTYHSLIDKRFPIRGTIMAMRAVGDEIQLWQKAPSSPPVLIGSRVDTTYRTGHSAMLLAPAMHLDDFGAGSIPHYASVDDYYVAQSRARIKSTDGFRRGRPSALIGAAQAHLIGSKSVILRERDTSPWHFTVITRTSETPDPALVEAALLEQKPGGLMMTYQVLDGYDYQGILDNFATYQSVLDHYATYDAMETTI